MNTYFPSFFIIGTQRSGTTLLRLILNSHNEIAVPEEATFFMPLLTKCNLFSERELSQSEKQTLLTYISQNAQFQKWKLNDEKLLPMMESSLTYIQLISRIYEIYKENHKKSFCGDKSPSFIRKLYLIADAFPDAKFLHIVRDGRDNYLSLKARKHSSAKSVAVFALEWKVKLRMVQQIQEKFPNPFMEIRYEDLVTTTEPSLRKICRFLQVDYDPLMLDFWRHSSEFIDRQHSELIFKPIDGSNIKKWMASMSAREKMIFEVISGDTLRKYEYPTIGNVDLLSKTLAYIQLLSRLPERITRITYISMYMKLASRFGWAVSSDFY